MKPIIVSVQHISKEFKDLKAVENISFDLHQGEILGLLGPNGAGKTTIFQMLLGILTPSSGVITYFNKELHKHRSEILERVNFSSTYTNLPWNLKVSDTLAFISRLYQINNRKKRVGEMIETFRLGPLLKKGVVTLSAGELTRLNLAKAFINSPEVVLLDEPTASLDPEIAHVVRDYILQQRKNVGISVIFTSHNMTEVETVCDRVVFIQRGKIMADDTPANLARTLDLCRVALLVPQEKRALFTALCEKEGLSALDLDGYSSVQMSESQVSHFLGRLAESEIPLHGLTVTRSTLEDYFLKQAGEKRRGRE
jgi:ABC-2 type transport system ATP-binding protein